MKIDAPIIMHDDEQALLTYRFKEGIPDGWYILHDGREFHYDNFDLVLQQVKDVPDIDALCKIPRHIAASIGWERLKPPKEVDEETLSMADIDENEMIRVATRLRLLKEQINMLIRHLDLDAEDHIL